MTRGFSLLILILLPLLAFRPAAAATTDEPVAVETATAPGPDEKRPRSFPTMSGIDRRFAEEEQIGRSRFALLPHKPSYLLPVSYITRINAEPLEVNEHQLDRFEVKFQFSFKVNLLENILDHPVNLAVAYTQQSVWQAYNSDSSSPFRDNVYEPEAMLTLRTDVPVLGLRNRLVSLGIVHQSNGRGLEEASRSWNRVYALFALERGDFAMALKPWVRLPEAEEEDDNPDISRYYGYGELYLLYNPGRHSFGLMVRNNLRANNRTTLQLDYSFPISTKIRFYVQAFTGYGDTLVDYNFYNNRIGVGFLLANWL